MLDDDAPILNRLQFSGGLMILRSLGVSRVRELWALFDVADWSRDALFGADLGDEPDEFDER